MKQLIAQRARKRSIHPRSDRRYLVAVALVALNFIGCGEVAFVDRVILVNETEYSAHVDVRGSSGSWLGLTTVRAGATKEVRAVIDQGELWTFRFSYANHDPVEIEVTKSELVTSDWRVEVPTELEENLRDEGVPPPP